LLSLTGPAVEAIRVLTRQPGRPEETGLRIVHQDSAGTVELTIAAGPQDGDEIIESGGVRVFLEKEVAVMLGDKVLNARVRDDGIVFIVDEEAAGGQAS
jgi:iron-sulfur cluster assembly protein